MPIQGTNMTRARSLFTCEYPGCLEVASFGLYGTVRGERHFMRVCRKHEEILAESNLQTHVINPEKEENYAFASRTDNHRKRA